MSICCQPALGTSQCGGQVRDRLPIDLIFAKIKSLYNDNFPAMLREYDGRGPGAYVVPPFSIG